MNKLDLPKVVAAVGADDERVKLSLASSDQLLVKVLTWQEAVRLGAKLLREATRLMP